MHVILYPVKLINLISNLSTKKIYIYIYPSFNFTHTLLKITNQSMNTLTLYVSVGDN